MGRKRVTSFLVPAGMGAGGAGESDSHCSIFPQRGRRIALGAGCVRLGGLRSPSSPYPPGRDGEEHSGNSREKPLVLLFSCSVELPREQGPLGGPRADVIKAHVVRRGAKDGDTAPNLVGKQQRQEPGKKVTIM